ncbi:ABC transporter ATP-binding protein/permease [Photobacterium damselae]|uniref:ABC transporter ATP-binding protein/permease n=1 Tax=Photobacterium damselae TaxID=38293 RepID=UPI001F373152|nr:ABC transporter ATP-binding protein/permease [Photobacterium damselae]UKA28244.1 ABC transporter ATP-binding protein/permease [Photobacterium damselae subsp. damselae]
MKLTDSVQLSSRHFLGKVWQLAKPYWQSEEKWIARGLLFAIVILNLGMVYMSVILNKWNADFYNALQQIDKAAFTHLLIKFSLIAAGFIIIAIYRIYLNMMLQLRWRRWLTQVYFSDWLSHRVYYQLELEHGKTDNPDQRISEDINQFTSDTLGLALGLLNSVVTLASFITILWGLSGSMSVDLLGHHIEIPGAMVWAALLYAGIGSWIMHKIGRPLIGLNFMQQKFEADLRFSMIRLRENAEGVALYQGEKTEQQELELKFDSVWKNTWKIMRKQKQMVGFNSGYSQIASIFPLVITAPRFFSGAIKLGGMMQIVNAFGQVMDAMSWFVNSYASIASWKASVDRLTTYHEHMIEAREQTIKSQLHIELSNQDHLTLSQCSVGLPNKEILFTLGNLSIAAGEHTLIAGPSGLGKSSLMKTIAGIWPFSQGEVERNNDALFLPQRPYLPIATLRDVLLYPQKDTLISDATLVEWMHKCSLSRFVDVLSERHNWAHVMSPGEQQRVALLRAFIQQPKWLFLDEATASLDEETEARMYQLLLDELPQTTLISIAHRSVVAKYHKQVLRGQRTDDHQVRWDKGAIA